MFSWTTCWPTASFFPNFRRDGTRAGGWSPRCELDIVWPSKVRWRRSSYQKIQQVQHLWCWSQGKNTYILKHTKTYQNHLKPGNCMKLLVVFVALPGATPTLWEKLPTQWVAEATGGPGALTWHKLTHPEIWRCKIYFKIRLLILKKCHRLHTPQTMFV